MWIKNEKIKAVLAALAIPARVYMGIVFIAASLFKIYEPYQFALSVATYQILPLELINVQTLVLPWLELFVGILLILGVWTKENAFLICGMMVMFIVALSIALSHDLQMSCGCFASQEAADEIGMHTVFRDLGWLAIGAYIFFFDDGRFGLDRFLNRKRRANA